MEKKQVSSDKQIFYICMTFFVFMMLFNLLHSSPWGDEWVEYHYSQREIGDGSLYNAIVSTFQPPLYNLLMHFWLKISKTILWFRLFNVFCGIISGIALYGTIKRLTNSRLATGALFMLGITYQWIYCVQECSEYTLMLMFLFLSFYFYIRTNQENNLNMQIFFILSCVSAMYSQYGAFFIIVPLLLAHFIKKILDKEKKEIFKTAGMYFVALIIFAFPLYMFFAKIQMERNQIAQNSIINLSVDNIINFPLIFGKLIGYILNLNNREWLNVITTIIGIIILILAIALLIIKTSLKYCEKSMIIILLVAYILFYWLVTFNIYAMVHPNQSAGFYSRYSSFFIPAFYIIIPVILYQSTLLIKRASLRKWSARATCCIVAMLLFIAYPSLLDNWHKAFDREFAEVWINNAGFSETTYLLGVAHFGFNYYTNQYHCVITGETSTSIDLQNLPDSFWVWRTNWGGDMWQTTVDTATEQGYKVIIYADHGYSGQLAYCTK